MRWVMIDNTVGFAFNGVGVPAGIVVLRLDLRLHLRLLLGAEEGHVESWYACIVDGL